MGREAQPPLKNQIMRPTSLFETFSDAVDAAQVELDKASAELVFGTASTPADDHWTQQIFSGGPIPYGAIRRHDFEVLAYKGKPSRKWFHIVITRMDSGRYELVTYFL